MRELITRRLHRDESGVTLVIVALCLIALFGMLVLVVDVGGLLLNRREMVNASDAAALAAAKSVMNNSSGTAVADAQTYAAKYSINGTALAAYTVIPGTWTPGGGFVSNGGDWANAQAVRDSSATPTRLIGEQVAQVVSAADRRVERLRKDVVARAAPTGKADVASPVDASVVLVR